MRFTLAIALLASTVAGCTNPATPVPDAGISPVNVPVVSRTTYAFDAAAPGGVLAPSEAARLDAWFRSLELRYGDTIYVDAGYSQSARADVARVAGNYGLLVSPGAPVTAGAVPPGTVRVVVSRTEASVPNCPNWGRPSQPNYDNRMLPGFGCAVNGNMAAMIANPEDLVYGREGSGVVDTLSATKAIRSYRDAVPTGTEGLKDISTKKEDN